MNFIILLLLTNFANVLAHEEVDLSGTDICSIFLGKTVYEPVFLPFNHEVSEEFFQVECGKHASAIGAYWIRQGIQGRAAPKVLMSQKEVCVYVEQTPFSVGYGECI